MAGAVVLGVAALFVVKVRPDQHWSDPPVIEIVVDRDQKARSGGPPEMP